MTAFDYVVLAIIGVSVGLGWWRGFVYELLSLLGWAAAYFVARLFASEITRYVPDVVASDVAKTAVAYACLFIGTLIVSGIVAWSLSKLIKFVGLGLMDGMMGALFGLLRGMLLVLILVLLAGLTGLPQQPFWRDAWSSRSLQSAALFTKYFLPENVAKKVTY
ncbi:MAG: CvpA family protein [Gallionellaceae bacterium]|nr:MAG: CvpA family protein [Gallionellaceae bacterium]